MSTAVSCVASVAGREIGVLFAAGGGASLVWVLGRVVAAQRSHSVVLRLSSCDQAAGPPALFVTLLDQTGLSVGPEAAWRWTVRGTVAALVAGLVTRPAGTAVVVVGVAAVSWAVVKGRISRGRQSEPHQLAALIDALLFRLASGSSLSCALEQARVGDAALGPMVDRVVDRVAHGVGVQTALDEWARSSGSPGVTLLADAVAIAGSSGGSQQAALVGVQATLAERDALAREVRALTSQARLSGLVLAVTPVGFAVLVAAMDDQVAAFLASPAGWACVTVGLGLDAVGGWWMHRLAGSVA